MEGKGARVRTLTLTLSRGEREEQGTYQNKVDAPLGRIWMVRQPVPGDLFTPTNPHVLVCHDMVQKALQTRGTARMATDAHV